MKKEINLEEIFKQQNPQDGNLPNWAKEFALEACRQVLELAAENAKLKPHRVFPEINKQSILDTINQIK